LATPPRTYTDTVVAFPVQEPGSNDGACYIDNSTYYSQPGPFCSILATVAADPGLPATGSVSFYVDGVLKSSVALSNNRAATTEQVLGVTPLRFENQSSPIITAVYSGDENYVASQSIGGRFSIVLTTPSSGG
jgi:hypothetical protein